MNEKWFVIGTDERLKMVAKKLSDETRTIFYKCTDQWNQCVNDQLKSFSPTHIILPIQPLTLEESPLHVEHVKWFVGKMTPEWKKILNGQSSTDYLSYEPFIWKNAELTALGVLTYLLSTQQLVKGKKIIITGFGRVAKMLAILLVKLGAQIIITARSHVQLAEANAFGYEAVFLHPVHQQSAQLLINTIPFAWLDDSYAIYQTLNILDVASAPGCCKSPQNLKSYQFLHALPARYFPQAAANLLYEAIIELNKGGEMCLKENE